MVAGKAEGEEVLSPPEMSAQGDASGATQNGLRIERLTELDQFERCVDIQRATWNYSAEELFPRRVFQLAERIGGHVLGAFAGSDMVAFNVAYPGHRDGLAYLHSQMLAVLPAWRNSGVGRGLKLAQRDIALREGFDLIEWTYDPLEIKNAFFNLHRLGAISRRYVRDFYGPSTSPLQGGLPTDRLYAEWWVRSERVARTLSRSIVSPSFVEAEIEVPGEIYRWKETGDTRAAMTQQQVRERLEHSFARGLIVVDYARLQNGDGRYLLGTWSEPVNGKEVSS